MYNIKNEEDNSLKSSLPKQIFRETATSCNEINIETFHQEQGILFLNGSITFETSNQLMMNLLYMAQKAMPLKLMINSGGGSVEAGLIIHDLDL